MSERSAADPAEAPYHIRRATDRAAQQGVDWWVMRVAISEQFRSPPHLVRAWPLWDFIEAHMVLDSVDEIRAAEESRRKSAG